MQSFSTLYLHSLFWVSARYDIEDNFANNIYPVSQTIQFISRVFTGVKEQQHMGQKYSRMDQIKFVEDSH